MQLTAKPTTAVATRCAGPPRRAGAHPNAADARAATWAFGLAVLMTAAGFYSLAGSSAGAGALLCLTAAFLAAGVGASLRNSLGSSPRPTLRA